MILHPEILLGRKGDPFSLKLFKIIDAIAPSFEAKTGADVVVTDEQHALIKKYGGDSFMREIRRNTDVGQQHLKTALKFYSRMGKKFPVYRINKDFFSALSSVDSSIKINVQAMFPVGSGYVSIPHTTISHLSDELGERANGFYWKCYIHPGGEYHTLEVMGTTSASEREENCVFNVNDQKHIHVRDAREDAREDVGMSMAMHVNMKSPIATVTFAPHIQTLEDVERSILGTKASFDHDGAEADVSQQVKSEYWLYFKSCLNSIIYINSQQPDLQKSVPDSGLTVKRKRELLSKGIETNEFSIPVTLVSWRYQKPHVYRVGSTEVSGHFRWQPCGIAFSQVKLIWIKAHERHYKNTLGEISGKGKDIQTSNDNNNDLSHGGNGEGLRSGLHEVSP